MNKGLATIIVAVLEFHLLQLNGVREHDNHTTLATVDHLPEVSCGGAHRPLSDDECSLLLVSLHSHTHTHTHTTHTHAHTHTHNTHASAHTEQNHIH